MTIFGITVTKWHGTPTYDLVVAADGQAYWCANADGARLLMDEIKADSGLHSYHIRVAYNALITV
jgi:hypothetical protein